MIANAKILDPWHNSQSWQAHGHQWNFVYDKFNVRFTISNSDLSITLSVPIVETKHYPSPQAWLDKWAKSKEGRQRLKPAAQPEQPSLFDRLGRAGGDRIGKTNQPEIPSWSDWTWLDGKLVRFNLDNQSQVEECCDLPTLESHLQSLEKIRQEYLDKAQTAQGSRSKELMRGVKNKDKQIKWVKNQLKSLGGETTPIAVEVVDNSSAQLTNTEELTDDELRDRLFLERKVERAFFSAGVALQELRDRRLYRNTHQTFSDYCQERFGYSRRKMDYLIAGSEVYKNLSSQTRTNCSQTEPPDDESQMRTNCSQNAEQETRTNCSQILPTREAQVRPLTKLEPMQQREAWAKAVEKAGGKVPSSRIVKDIVDQIRERTKVPNPWRVGEVATIIVKDNPELRGKGGCWAVISAVHDFSCTVRLWDGEYQVKPENLKDLPYSNEQQEEVRKLCDRLSKLYDPEMEETAKAILSSLGKIDRPWLTELEERLLKILEDGNF